MTTIIPAFLILTTENTENSWCPAMDFQFQFGHPSVTELGTPDVKFKLSPGLAAGMVAAIESTRCRGGISAREVKPSPGVLSQPMDPTESGAHSVTMDQLGADRGGEAGHAGISRGAASQACAAAGIAKTALRMRREGRAVEMKLEKCSVLTAAAPGSLKGGWMKSKTVLLTGRGQEIVKHSGRWWRATAGVCSGSLSG